MTNIENIDMANRSEMVLFLRVRNGVRAVH